MLIAPLKHPGEISIATAERIRPPRRVLPSDAAARYLKNDDGDWDPSVAPMIAEPLNQLASRKYQGIVFVGPQRSSKTFGLILGGITYIVTCAPSDTLIVQMTETTARRFSRGQLSNTISASPELKRRLSERANDDNVFDKWFRSGMAVKIGWPSKSQLSSDTLRYVFVTDYDSVDGRDNIDGSGPLFDLAFKRIQTYMSRGKCLAESYPREDLVDTKWEAKTPHEAPPVRGILSIYNNGTRARWYWPCWHCNELFEAKPGYELFGLPSFDKLKQMVVGEDIETLAAEFARVICPHCSGIHEPDLKQKLNAAGHWLHEGQRVEGDQVVGEPRATNIWSGWLGGVAASYQRWDSIIRSYLQGVLTYVRTGDESTMRLVTRSDAGSVYIPRVVRNRRSAETLVKRAEVWPQGAAPVGVRFLTAAADVQGGKFVIQVHGWGVGLQSWIVDRYDVTASRRPEGDGNAGLDPAAYLEDWLVLMDAMERTYPVVGTEVELPIHFMLVDSGGQEGVTQNAYQFWRQLREKGLGQRLQLVKGDGRPSAPRLKETWPDTRKRRDRKSGAAGDVPVWAVGTNILKDGVAGDLAREVPGPGYIHLPDWLNKTQPEVFDELVAEVRDEKGAWKNPSGRRNEGLDLCVYNRAAVIALGAEKIDWDNPPPWAADPEAQQTLRKRAPSRRRRRVRSSGVQL